MGACPGANERALRKTGNGVEVHSAAARHEYRAWIPCAAHTRRGTCASPCLLLDPMPERARARARGTGWPSSIVGPSSWAPSSGKDTLYPASCVILYIYREKRYIERSTFFIYFIDRACTCAPVLLLRTLRISLSLSFSFFLFLAARFLLLRLA